MGWDGLGTLVGKISQQFQTRIERLKNERDQLNAEKDILMAKKPLTARDANRIYSIDVRVCQIKLILENNAKD